MFAGIIWLLSLMKFTEAKAVSKNKEAEQRLFRFPALRAQIPESLAEAPLVFPHSALNCDIRALHLHLQQELSILCTSKMLGQEQSEIIKIGLCTNRFLSKWPKGPFLWQKKDVGPFPSLTLGNSNHKVQRTGECTVMSSKWFRGNLFSEESDL